MNRSLLFVGGLLLPGMWVQGAGPAGATTYDYGVGVWQQYDNSAPNTDTSIKRSDGQYCFPLSCLGFNGTTSIVHSQANSISGTSYYPYKNFPYTGSENSSNTSKVDMGAIHLVTDASAAGGGTAQTLNEGYWTDTLTIGNNFASGTKLKFLVNQDLSDPIPG